ncbi:MAG TPA: protein-glutamate O-methyltransferase CheR [Nitrospirota bacterium]|nr:protein-glutamate O-methyltransferase CheR [Nitrospirota bacterium]
MSDREFLLLSEFIHRQCGIKLPPVKKSMLEARLQKRLRSLGITSFREYFELLFESPAGKEELVHMIDSVTTNKTDFFREPVHFSYLAENILPEFMRTEGGGAFMVWSAGCSSGEEPYTLAMVLNEFRGEHPGFRFSILATDISTKVLEKARLGIYDQERVVPVPSVLKQKCVMRGSDRSKGLVRIVPELRSLVRFQRANLMDDHCALSEPADVIFCRNVIIYFGRATQERLLWRLCRSLKPGGYLFLGHSETMHGFDLPLVRVVSTVYRKMS